MLLQNRFVLVNLAANVAFVLCGSGIVRFQFLLDQCGWVVVIQTIVLLQTVLISEYNFSFFLFFFFFFIVLLDGDIGSVGIFFVKENNLEIFHYRICYEANVIKFIRF